MIWKRYLALSVSCLFSTWLVIRACGWGPYDPEYDTFNIYDVNDIPIQIDNWHRPDPSKYAWNDWHDYKHVRPNLKEWMAFIGGNLVDTAAVYELIYRKDTDDWTAIEACVKTGDCKETDAQYGDNELYGHLRLYKPVEVVDYLVYTKLNERFVKALDYWDRRNMDMDTYEAERMAMMDLALERYNTIKDPFLRKRYAYQYIRGLHYSGQYEAGLDWYDAHIKESNEKDLTDYWLLAHKAGMYHSIGETVMANYLFLQVYMHCPSPGKRNSSRLSIKFKSLEIWERTLSMCKTTEERAALTYILQAGDYHHALGLQPLKKQFEIDPTSKYLEDMMTRQVNFAETMVLPGKYGVNEYWEVNYDYYERHEDDYEKKFATDFGKLPYLDSLVHIAQKCYDHKKVKNKQFWLYHLGYLKFLNGEFEEAQQLLSDFLEKGKPEKQLAYKVQAVIHTAELKKHLTLSPEVLALIESKKIGIGGYYELFNAILAEIICKEKNELCFLAQGSPGRDWNLLVDPYGDYYADIALLEKENKTPLEAYVARGSYDPNFLRNLQVTNHIANYEYEKALEVLATIPENNSNRRSGVGKCPFEFSNTGECHYYNFDKDLVTKEEFCKRMIELQDLVESDPDNAPQYYYELAAGYFNQTFEGNSWLAAAFFKGAANYGGYATQRAHENLYDWSKSSEMLHKAYELSDDPEFKAKCVRARLFYVWARYNNAKHNNRRYDGSLSSVYGELYTDYRSTQVYKELLNECGSFENFVNSQ